MKKRTFLRKRRFKRTSSRKLSPSDLSVLDFLWTWKVASTPMLTEWAYKGNSPWWVYKALRQLERERYIQALPRGKYFAVELWALTDLGFEVVLMDRDDIAFHRYRPHAPAHDYLATCLQLGELWLGSVDRQFFTEQMLASLAPSNFPKGFKKAEGHVPDGLTLMEGALQRALVGYEVDLNLKTEDRYRATFAYYEDEVKPALVIWLVRSPWMATRILEVYREARGYKQKPNLSDRLSFILLDDFKARVWDAQVLGGRYQGMSISKLHANLLQSLGKPAPKGGQKPLAEIFFPEFKSPQKTIASAISLEPEIHQHPSGPG
jgi:hypothetical protein